MSDAKKESSKSEETYRREPNWPGVLFQLYVHASFVYGSFFLIQSKLLTLAFNLTLVAVGLLGSTAGAHRLWAHRSYSAHITLRIFLMLCHTLGGTGTIYNWVLDHRIHHKYHGTNNDPFNYKRGFFYAHLGNRMVANNPNRKNLIKEIDMSDIESDKVVMFQKRFYWVLMPIISLLLPINAPVEYWGEGMLLSIMTVFFRIPITLHGTWLINSARGIWDLKPDDRFFSDSNLVFVIKKSHWHAYHYTVPWDCLSEEFGGSYNCSCTTIFIKIWAAMGLATDLKTIDGKGLTMALEQALDTGKPASDCITEMRDEMQLFQNEDNALLLESSVFAVK